MHLTFFQVFDQYLSFISLEDDMFTLRHQNSQAISYYGNYKHYCYLCSSNISELCILASFTYRILESTQIRSWPHIRNSKFSNLNPNVDKSKEFVLKSESLSLAWINFSGWYGHQILLLCLVLPKLNLSSVMYKYMTNKLFCFPTRNEQRRCERHWNRSLYWQYSRQPLLCVSYTWWVYEILL